MEFEPVKRLEIKNYGCIRDLALELTPLHALIGPNDSGKSTVLRGLRTVAQLGSGQFARDRRSELRPFDPLLSVGSSSLVAEYPGDKRYGFWSLADGRIKEEIWEAGASIGVHGRALDVKRQWGPIDAFLTDRLMHPMMVRFEPDYLREPAPLIPELEPVGFADERGRGLASVYDAIVNRNVKAFLDIESKVKELFPTVERIRLINRSAGSKELAVSLKDGTPVEARAMSEGLLYYLAFAALKYLDYTRVFLVEEPENGLHPARIADVMAVLRRVSEEGAQVLIATHSPLILNELRKEEVTVLTRDEAGTHATPIKDTPNFEERSQVYALGELWLSYANGVDEAPLLKGGSRT
jgi:predicted ATPase